MKAHAIRFVAAIALAAATLTISATADPADAHAREWDVQVYDDCLDGSEGAWMAGDITAAEYMANFRTCCDVSGGQWDPNGGPHGNCGAPPALAPYSPAAPPSEVANPDVPAGSAPPTKPGPKALVPRILGTPTSTPVPVG